jgi:hypothetical protein
MGKSWVGQSLSKLSMPTLKEYMWAEPSLMLQEYSTVSLVDKQPSNAAVAKFR